MPDWGTQPDFDRKTHSVTPRNPVLPGTGFRVVIAGGGYVGYHTVHRGRVTSSPIRTRL